MPRKFIGSDEGLKVPRRRLQVGSFGLRIINLDTDDPPLPYHDGGVPRTADFNRNIRTITDEPKKPEIPVECEIKGFDPKSTPIFWRLQTLHVLCRYEKTRRGDYGIPGNYRDRVVRLSDEWAGQTDTTSFTIFPKAEQVRPRDGSDRISGGHAILTVAAKPDGAGGWLQDYVHLRLGGDNPSMETVRAEVKSMISGRSDNLLYMLYAIFAWEARAQFAPKVQSRAIFKNLGTRFDWPADPPNYPLAAFDFGVGFAQYTHPNRLTTGIAWDWRENLKSGINIFLGNLEDTHLKNTTWQQWALRAWSAYNGTKKKNSVTAYGRRLRKSPDGLLVSAEKVPPTLDLAAFLQRLSPRPTMPPPDWPVDDLPMLVRMESIFEPLSESGWDEGTDDHIASFDPPKPVPTRDPFEFAVSAIPAKTRYWPILTKNADKLVVSYETVGGHIIGKFDRRFLAKRQVLKEGSFKRYHVGIDLFARRRDVVVACEDGTIVAFYAFYPARTKQMTYALLIEFEGFVANFGEVLGNSPKEFGWRTGDPVKAGQQIARISDTAMLHFETYEIGTRRNEHYYPGKPKPAHLLNPTEYLLEIRNNGIV